MSNLRDVRRDAEIVTLYHSGLNASEIGDGLGLSRERIRQILRRNGIRLSERFGWGRIVPGSTRGRERFRRASKPWIETQRLRREWRWRLAVWVVRDLAADLGDTPRLNEVTTALGMKHRHSLMVYLDGTRTRKPTRELTMELYGAAGMKPQRCGRHLTRLSRPGAPRPL